MRHVDQSLLIVDDQDVPFSFGNGRFLFGSLRPFLCEERKLDRENRSLAGSDFDVYLPFMILDNAVNHRQAQAGSFAFLFVVKKGSKICSRVDGIGPPVTDRLGVCRT